MTYQQSLATIALMATLIQRYVESAFDASEVPDEDTMKRIARMTVSAMQAGAEAINAATEIPEDGPTEYISERAKAYQEAHPGTDAMTALRNVLRMEQLLAERLA